MVKCRASREVGDGDHVKCHRARTRFKDNSLAKGGRTPTVTVLVAVVVPVHVATRVVVGYVKTTVVVGGGAAIEQAEDMTTELH
jgi:hypothetical protein